MNTESTGSILMEDVDCAILMSIDERHHFYYAMGFVERDAAVPRLIKPQNIGDGAARAVIVRDGSVWEMVLGADVSASFVCSGKRHGWTEGEWERFVAECVEGRVMRVQTACVLTRDSAGAACLERLIEKDIARKKKAFVAVYGNMPQDDVIDADAELLSCFRSASGGRMHPLDRRPWLMSTVQRFQMEFERQSALEESERLMQKCVELGARIRRGYEVLDCARYIAVAAIVIGDLDSDNELHSHRMAAIQRTEEELHEMEAREMDMLAEADTLQKLAVRHDTVLQRQCALDAKIKADDDEAFCGKKKRTLLDISGEL